VLRHRRPPSAARVPPSRGSAPGLAAADQGEGLVGIRESFLAQNSHRSLPSQVPMCRPQKRLHPAPAMSITLLVILQKNQILLANSVSRT